MAAKLWKAIVQRLNLFFRMKKAKVKISLESLCVYVCGAVNNPGVIYLDEGSRICDAIKKAGGITADADINSLNQAER